MSNVLASVVKGNVAAVAAGNNKGLYSHVAGIAGGNSTTNRDGGVLGLNVDAGDGSSVRHDDGHGELVRATGSELGRSGRDGEVKGTAAGYTEVGVETVDNLSRKGLVGRSSDGGGHEGAEEGNGGDHFDMAKTECLRVKWKLL